MDDVLVYACVRQETTATMAQALVIRFGLSPWGSEVKSWLAQIAPQRVPPFLTPTSLASHVVRPSLSVDVHYLAYLITCSSH